MRRLIALFAILVLFFAACGSDDESGEGDPTATTVAPEESTPEPTQPAADDTTGAEEPDPEDPQPVATPEPTPEPVIEITPIPIPTSDPIDPPEPVSTDNPAFSSTDKLSTAGLGSMFFGMTPEGASQTLATEWAGGPEDGTPTCYLLAPAHGPTGVVLTVFNSSIERVDITNPTITTRSGAGVGNTEAKLHELFGERLVVTPYADGSGNSIQYVPVDESDVDYRVIFETDGASVTSMRAGRLPTVAPSQPCT